MSALDPTSATPTIPPTGLSVIRSWPEWLRHRWLPPGEDAGWRVLRDGDPVPYSRLLVVAAGAAAMLLAAPAAPGEVLQLLLYNRRVPGWHRAELRVARCGGVRSGFLVVGTLAEPLPEDAWMLLLA
jgi:hypothetical protein